MHDGIYSRLNVRLCDMTHIDILIPILIDEFDTWSHDSRRNYLQQILQSSSCSAGVLAAQNDEGYFVGLLIYEFRQGSSNLGAKKKEEEHFSLEIISMLSTNSMFRKEIIGSLIKGVQAICVNNYCDLIKIPNHSDVVKILERDYKDNLMEKPPDWIYLTL